MSKDPKMFFVDTKFKIWSENGEVKNCNGYEDCIDFMVQHSGDRGYRLFTKQLNDKLKMEFVQTLVNIPENNKEKVNLEELVEKVTPENKQEYIDYGKKGKELI